MLILSAKLKNQFGEAYTVSLKNIIINGNKRGCSGFISRGNRTAYVTTEPCGSLGLMYRTAKHVKDFKGGHNAWAKSLDELVQGITALLASEISTN